MSRRHSSILPQFNFQTSLKFALITTSLLVILGFGYEATAAAAAEATFNEECETGLTADNRTLDTCATEKFLTCQNSRCACADIRNQIWVSTRITVTVSSGLRWKRSPAKGFKVPSGKIFKPKGPVISAPIIPVGIPVGIRRKATTQAPKTFEIFSACYSRVGGTCLLSPSQYRNSIISIGLKRLQESFPTPAAQEATPINTPKISTHTTTEPNEPEIQISAQNSAGKATVATEINVEYQGVPEIEGATQLSTNSAPTESSIGNIQQENLNTTERNNSAVNSNGTQTINSRGKNNTSLNIETSRLSIPSCVQFATCVPREIKIEDGKVIVDPNDPKDDIIGVCQCIEGFVKNKSGLCVKKVITEPTSGGDVLNVAYFLIIACLFRAPLHCV